MFCIYLTERCGCCGVLEQSIGAAVLRALGRDRGCEDQAGESEFGNHFDIFSLLIGMLAM